MPINVSKSLGVPYRRKDTREIVWFGPQMLQDGKPKNEPSYAGIVADIKAGRLVRVPVYSKSEFQHGQYDAAAVARGDFVVVNDQFAIDTDLEYTDGASFFTAVQRLSEELQKANEKNAVDPNKVKVSRADLAAGKYNPATLKKGGYLVAD